MHPRLKPMFIRIRVYFLVYYNVNECQLNISGFIPCGLQIYIRMFLNVVYCIFLEAIKQKERRSQQNQEGQGIKSQSYSSINDEEIKINDNMIISDGE